MKEAKIPIKITVNYTTEKEKIEKINAISWLLKEIAKWDNKLSDINSLKKLTQIIKNRITKRDLFIYIIASLIFLLFLFNVFIGLDITEWTLKTSIYLWQKNALGYYIENEKLRYWEVLIKWCDKKACLSNKWIVIKRLIDCYY